MAVIRAHIAAAAAFLAGPALADPVCTFTEECYMTLACEETAYEMTVDRDAGLVSTLVEDLEILHVEEQSATQILARGMGALHLLTIGPATAVLSVHIGTGPAAITYYGSCTE